MSWGVCNLTSLHPIHVPLLGHRVRRSHLIYSANRIRSDRQLLLGAQTPPVRISGAGLPYLDPHKLRRNKITPASSPSVGRARHHLLPQLLRPNTKGHYYWDTIIIPYTSWPSVRPYPVRSISEGRPPGTICK